MAFEYNQGQKPTGDNQAERERTVKKLRKMIESSSEEPDFGYQDDPDTDETGGTEEGGAENQEGEVGSNELEDFELKAEEEAAEQKGKQKQYQRLKEIYDKPRFWPSLTLKEKIAVRMGKKNFPAIVNKIQLKLQAIKAGLRMSGSLLASVASFLAIPIFIFVCVAMAFTLLFSSIDDPKSGTDGVEYGTPASLLYGVRAIYEDKAEARTYLAQSYGEIISFTINEVNGSNSFQINVTLPTDENFNYDNLITNYQDNGYDYYHYAQLTYKFATAVYQNDLAQGLTSTEASNFETTLDAITYFGLDSSVEDGLAQNLADYIWANESLMTNKPSTKNDLQNEIKKVINSYLNDNTIRTKKLFIIDIPVVEGKNAPSLVTKRNYKAYIYLNKTAMKVDYLCYSTTGKITLTATANGSPVEVGQPQEADSSSDKWMYETSNNLNLTVDVIGDNYVENDPLLKDGKSASLLDLAKSENKEKYLTLEGDIYTYSTYGLCINMQSTNNFSFGEISTTIS